MRITKSDSYCTVPVGQQHTAPKAVVTTALHREQQRLGPALNGSIHAHS